MADCHKKSRIMALISFSDISRFYGRQDILTGVTLTVNQGEKVGLVGRNGAGKTTIIRLIMGEESPDGGQITSARGLRIGYLPQDILAEGGQSLLAMVMDTAKEYREVEEELKLVAEEIGEKSADPEAFRAELIELAERQGHLLHLFESLGGWEKESSAKKILSGLGFEENDFLRELSEFSGGWIMRAVLARLLLAEPDLLVLDEPTNHLDIDSLLWLEGYLKSSASALLLVSHDRVFLNNVAQKIIEIRQGKAYSYQGNYDFYLAEKALRLGTEAAAFENQQERIKQIEKFIEKNKVRASTARRAQSRLKMLEKMDRLDAPEKEENSFSFRLPQPSRGPDQVVELVNLAKSYGAVEVYQNLNLLLRRGERLALIGPNGRGKSTLLKMLAGLEFPTSGQRRLGQGVSIGYFAQFQMDSLNPVNTILEELQSVAGDLGQGSLRSVLGSFLFSGDEVFKKVSVLSGGEKARLALAKIMLEAPNLLLLDEPTNHLDIPGRQMLEDALSDFPGTMVLISHDRHFVNALCDHMGIIEDGGLTVHPGDFEDYLRLWAKNEGPQKRPGPLKGFENEAAALGQENEKISKEERRRQEAQARKELSIKKKPLEKKIAEAEKRLEEIAVRKNELSDILAKPETYKDQSLSKDLNLEFQNLSQEALILENQWEEAMQALEKI